MAQAGNEEEATEMLLAVVQGLLQARWERPCWVWVLIEFACEPDSRLSAVMMECGGEAIRVRFALNRFEPSWLLLGSVLEQPLRRNF